MSSCLSGRTYGYNLENIVKPSLSSSNSNSKSNSSTLSASSDSLMPVSTRKPRTTRKRANQTYNEAVALLSTACPNIFTTTKKNNHSTLPFQHSYLFNNPTELLLPEKPIKAKPKTPRENEFNGNLNWSPNSSSLEQGNHDDFDTESMLDEDIGEGIDSILGNPNSVVEKDDISNGKSCFSFDFNFNSYFNPCFGYPVGVGIGGNLECKFGFGLRNGVRAMKNVDEGDRWSFPVVDVTNILPPEATKTEKSQIGKNKKVMKMEPECLIIGEERSSVENGPRLMLTLSYDKVLKAWSETGSPVPESPRSDIQTKLAQIDLFSENGGVIEVSVVRYKEKRRTRFFSKKIRYQVRKVNADLRPRSEGRFVRRPNSPTCEEI